MPLSAEADLEVRAQVVGEGEATDGLCIEAQLVPPGEEASSGVAVAVAQPDETVREGRRIAVEASSPHYEEGGGIAGEAIDEDAQLAMALSLSMQAEREASHQPTVSELPASARDPTIQVCCWASGSHPSQARWVGGMRMQEKRFCLTWGGGGERRG